MNENASDAVQLLIGQHRALENLLQKVRDESDPDRRRELFAKAGDQLTVHIKSEEDIFYPAVHAARTEDDLLESLEEHLSLKRLLADLVALEPEDKLFEPKFKVLKEQTEHHHKEEEEHLFPVVNKLVGAEQRQALGRDMLALQQRLKDQGEPREAMVNETGAAAPLE
jgi:hemerythrin superfamily protein